jgi:putative ABC transport system permease protein
MPMLRYAWQFMKYDKAKSLGIVIGIVISIFLIGQQSGIFIFLTNAMKALVTNSRSDLWVVDSKTINANALGKMDIRKVRELESIDGVARVFPVVVAGGTARFDDGTTAGVQLIGSDAPTFRIGLDPKKIIGGDLEKMLEDGAVSSDYFDRASLGGAELGTSFEINGKKAFIAVQTSGVRGFGGIFMFTTLERARYFGNLPNTSISAVLLDVKPGVDPLVVRDNINRKIFGVRAWSSADLASSTVGFLLANSGIGFSIGSLIVFALIAGFFIIGLTMYSAALDRIRDYGTLKGIGATNGYIVRLILLQAFLFSIAGFGLGYLFIDLFRQGVGKAGTVFNYSPVMILGFFLVTLLISLGGAAFAIRRIVSLEPASVFRG